ncbi:MAG: M36 family metallopeptidase [Acidobacteriota bacterium]
MQNSFLSGTRRGLLLTLFVLAVVTALILIPSRFRSEAGVKTGEGLVVRTTSNDDLLPNFDIRTSKVENGEEFFAAARQAVGKSASDIADFRDGFVRGEEVLKNRVETLKIEYSEDLRTPAVISPDVYKPTIERLTGPSSVARSEILRNFVKENDNLIGVSDAQADALRVAADYTNPNGYMSFARLDQVINDVPVYRGEIRAGFTKSGEMLRVLNDLAPGLDYGSLSTNFGNPLDAVRRAYGHINAEPKGLATSPDQAASTDLKVVFGKGDWATTAEKMYFPTEIGVARPSWRVLIWQPVNAFYVIVDAETGTMLSRENITADQTQPATYQIYGSPNGYIDSADSPAPLTPGPVDPTTGTQGAIIPARTLRTIIGNEAPNPGMNNLGWMTDNTNFTDGNALEAGIDRDGTNGVDAPQPGDAACPGAGCRTFTSTWNPPPGNPAPGDEPLIARAQRGAVVQMWYVMNIYHDVLYGLGFTEPARNFQNDNFGRGGVGADRVSAEGQDSSGTNNANFSTPADGGRGRMQMFLWTGPTPDYDGTADADVIIHEVTHGTSTRLHNGLGNQGGMMGEGWGDWYGHTMLAEPTDPINGIYTTGGYATFLVATGFNANYYYGIRRFPKAVIGFTGGPPRAACNNGPCPHNPLTFRHLNTGCDSEIGTTTTPVISAFPRGPIGTVGSCAQVHNAGEIWSSALWEVRALMVARLGFTAGTTRVLQVVTDGMKLAPANPNMLQERDAIIMSASTFPVAPESAADVLDVREGFRRRGMGFSASVTSSTVVTEAFDAADVSSGGTPAVTSGNGLLEPNECNTLNVPITNNSGNPATGITAVLSTTTPGITVTQPNSAYPNIPGGAGPINNTTPFQVSVDNTVACFTSANFSLTVTYSGGGGGSPLVANFTLPVGLPGLNYNFAASTGTIPAGGVLVAGSQADDAAVSIPLPSGWTSSLYTVAVTSLSASTNGIITANGATATTFTNTALPGAPGGANPTLFPYWDDLIMTTLRLANGGIFVNTIGSAPNRQLIIEWRAQHFSNVAADGLTTNFAVVLNEGSNQYEYIYTLTGMGGTTVNANGASATVGVQRQSTGTQFTQHSFNQAVITPGLKLSATLPGGMCTPGTGTCNAIVPRSRADFDGDGKTDVSVFRPSEGNWYLNRSTAGFAAIGWGISTDTLVPGDYDGDSKTDTAVFRPTNTAGAADFFVLNSNGFTVSGASWGNTGDVPVVGDYDGDGKSDFAVFRPSTSVWYVLNSSNGSNYIQPFGVAGDVPMAMDTSGDGKSQIAVFRPSNNTWYIARPTGTPATNFDAIPFGTAVDRLVPADYDGDNKDDVAVYRPSNGTWYVLKSTGGVSITSFGNSTDTPVPGDYDGDGKDDIAVFRPSSGTWFVLRSTAGLMIQPFGLSTDVPIPAKYIP